MDSLKHENYKIYLHTFPNNKVYIGQTKQNVERRWRHGNGYMRNSGQKIMINAINKYGWNNVKSRILMDNLDLNQANYYEAEFINFFNSANSNKGYNCKLGGNNTKVNDATRKRLSLAHKGILHSKEARRKISEGHKGHITSEVTKERISKSLMGHSVSIEVRKKISLAKIGKHYWSQKQFDKLSKKVLQIDILTGKVIKIWDSIRGAARGSNTKFQNISLCCHGKVKTVGGYKWMFETNKSSLGD